MAAVTVHLPAALRDLSWWRSRLAVALGFVAGLAVAAVVLATRDEDTRAQGIVWASTNLANLGQHPVPALIASAFVVADGDSAAWMVVAGVALVALAWRLGPRRTLAVITAAHLLGTGVSEGVVAWRLHTGAAPSQARHLIDVGPSYVVVAALVGAVIAGPWQARLVGAGGFALLAPSLFVGLTDLDVAAVGHVCAIAIGAGLTFLLRAGAARSDGAVGPPLFPG
jgi:hypothetical protein